MSVYSNARRFDALGMFGALFFVVNLLIEYRYDLFPPGTGWLFVANQLGFYAAMICLLLMLVGVWQDGAAGSGWLGRSVLGLFMFGLATLVVGGFIMLFNGNADLILFPIGGISMMLGSLLTGIAVIFARQWYGWQRFAPLVLGLFQPVTSMISGTIEPTLLNESLWMLAWFLVALALYTAHQRQLPVAPSAV